MPHLHSDWTLRGGDDAAGYQLDFDEQRRCIQTRVWGAWVLSIAKSYDAHMRSMFAKVAGQRWYMVGDIRQSPIQPVEVAQVRAGLMQEAHDKGVVRMVFLIDSQNPLPKMQMRRMALAAQCECNFFTDEGTGQEWLFGSEPGYLATADAG